MITLLAQTAPTEVRVEQRFEFMNLPQNWAAVLTILILGALCWWIIRTYRAESRSGSTRRGRMLLAGLRCIVVVLLVLIWLEPAMVAYWHQRIESYTLVLVDASSSLRIRDHYRLRPERQKVIEFASTPDNSIEPDFPLRRADLVNAILNGRDRAFFTQLSRRNRVHVHTFADDTAHVASIPANRQGDIFSESPSRKDVELQIEYDGPSTNLGQALRRAVNAVSGSPIAGIVIISDGNINEGEDLEVLGRFVRSQNLSVHTIGVGDASPTRNLRIAELIAPTNVFKDDPFELSARVRSSAVENEAVGVELSVQDAERRSPPRVVQRKSVTIRETGVSEPVTFTHQEENAGRLKFTLRAAPLPEETVTQDNSESSHINVVDNRMKVLLVSGGPSWNYRYLSRLLTRDKTFELSCWLQSADRRAVRDGNTIIDHLPSTPAELFVYDAILLLDPDAGQLPADWAKLIDRHVARNGGGLMYIAGRKQAPRFFRSVMVAPLVDLLPVVPDPEADLILNQIGYYQKYGSPVEIPSSASGHPALRGQPLGDAITHNPWETLTKVYWHYPVKHEKPAANVLMRHGHPRMRNSYGGHVLLATQFVGAGRCGFMAFDGTWRWRRYGEELYEQFWVQMIRYLAEGRLLGRHARGHIQSGRRRYFVGEPVTLDARLTDSDFAPLGAPSVTASVIRLGASPPQTDELVLHPDPNRPGWYHASFTPRATGRYVISVTLSASRDGEKVELVHEVDVRESDLELRTPEMNRGKLKALAGRSAGGAYYDINEADEVAELIPDRHETRVTRGSAEPVWNTAWMLALLIGLLGSEWALRKKWQLL